MATPAHRVHYTLSDYLELEAVANVKHEFLDGQIYAMAGGTPEHAALAAALIGLLFPQLRAGNRRAFDADLRVRVRETGLLTYPDVTVVCGPRELDPDDRNAVTNPTVLIEVTSPGTESYDRGDKLEHYKTISSLRECMIVSNQLRQVDVWRRDASGSFRLNEHGTGAVVRLESLGAELSVDELYEAAEEPA